MLADVVEKVLPPIAGAITGGLIGIISSYLTWQRQNKYEQKNIAYLLYQEFYIRSLLINQMLLTLKDLKPVDDYIYTEKDFYFLFRKEITSFNRELSNCIFRLYIYLIKSEKERLRINNYSGSIGGEDLYKPLVNNLELAQQELQNSQTLLRKYFYFTEQDFLDIASD